MAHTWHGGATDALESGYTGRKTEKGIEYAIQRGGKTISYAVQAPALGSITAPVEAIVGGPRHGLSFLARITQVSGDALARPVLVETRYLFSTPHRQLELSPGFSKEPPASWETALGRVLAPAFQARCLSCHGAPVGPALAQGGVQCESCHGPGEAHIASVANGKPAAIINPAKLSNEQRVQQCAACHADARPLADPLPGDLLISHQVEALSHSECYIQSGGGLNCSTCHNPHRDEPATIARSVKACTTCHGATAKSHAAICPVNQTSGCISCHMPTTQKDTFRMVDHWIRVVPGADSTHALRTASMRTQIVPRRAFLRLIGVEDRAKADALRTQLAAGAAFFDIARRHSTAPSGISGGYIGDVAIDTLETPVANAARQLDYGELSPVFESGAQWIIVQRLPRDFRFRANDLFEEGQTLKAAGKLAQAAEKYQNALQLYPRFLRALVFFGSTIGEQGDAARATAILEHAVNLYPDDTGALYNLGIAYGAAGRSADEIRTYERALNIDPDLTLAYLNMGAAFFTAGNLDGAADAFERGLQANPLSARLYYNLSLVRGQQGKADEARRLIRLAMKIDPKLSDREQGPRKPDQH